MARSRHDPARRWRDELAAWAIPAPILAAATESPYGFPVGLFRAETTASSSVIDTPSRRRALEALPTGGSVIDVGCGGGRASLALVPPAGKVIGVDSSAEMLLAYADAAAARGVEHREVAGTWPDVAAEAGHADVVVAHHVVYNVPDLLAFAAALSAAADRRVVIEMTDVHPWVPINPLWRRFHQLDRPSGPTAALATHVLRSAGHHVDVARWRRQPLTSNRAETVALIRRRLCLPPSADPDVDAALPEDYEFTPREIATLWWDVD